MFVCTCKLESVPVIPLEPSLLSSMSSGYRSSRGWQYILQQLSAARDIPCAEGLTLTLDRPRAGV